MYRTIVFYCWNGVKIDDAYTLPWRYHDINSVPLEIEVTKFFDDGTKTRTAAPNAETHTRFVLYPDTAYGTSLPQEFATSSVGLPQSDHNTIDSVIALSSNYPTIIYNNTLPDLDTGYLEATVKYETLTDSGCLVTLTPDMANMVRVQANRIKSDVISNIGDNGAFAITDIDTMVGSNNFDFTTTMPLLEAEANADGSGLKAGVHKYRLSFIYDGISISPLSDLYKEVTLESPDNIKLTLTLDLNMLYAISARITGINIYHAMVGVADGDELDLYRLVKSVQLIPENWTYASGVYTKEIIDSGTRYASFEIDSGYSESTRNISVDRSCQCISNNYLFVGNIRIPSNENITVNTDNVVMRSLPFQPSVFNYSEDFCILGFTPNALVSYRDRIYAFGDDEYSIINPESLVVEFTSKSCGVLNKNHVVATEYGIFLYHRGNVYHVSVADVSNIGIPIKTCVFDTGATYIVPSLDNVSGDDLFVQYLPSRNAVVIACKSYDSALFEDNPYNGILLFCYGIDATKWATYTVTQEDKDESRVIWLYQKDGELVIVVESWDDVNTKYCNSYKLFGGSGVRDMVLDYVLDFDDPNQDKMIYDVCTYNGSTKTSSEKLIDNSEFNTFDSHTSTYTTHKKKAFRVTITDDEPVNLIQVTIRRFVIK